MGEGVFRGSNLTYQGGGFLTLVLFLFSCYTRNYKNRSGKETGFFGRGKRLIFGEKAEFLFLYGAKDERGKKPDFFLNGIVCEKKARFFSHWNSLLAQRSIFALRLAGRFNVLNIRKGDCWLAWNPFLHSLQIRRGLFQASLPKSQTDGCMNGTASGQWVRWRSGPQCRNLRPGFSERNFSWTLAKSKGYALILWMAAELEIKGFPVDIASSTLFWTPLSIRREMRQIPDNNLISSAKPVMIIS